MTETYVEDKGIQTLVAACNVYKHMILEDIPGVSVPLLVAENITNKKNTLYFYNNIKIL